MTKTAWILAVVAAVLLAIVAWILWPASNDESSPGPLGSQTKTDDGAGGVTVNATLLPVAASGVSLSFDVVLDTHTVDLTSFDIVAHARLEDASGNRIQPGSGSTETTPGSHHKEARLVFPRSTGPVTLVITDLAGVPERRLEFTP